MAFTHFSCLSCSYLGLEKSWGRSRGPSGTRARPRPAWWWFIVGSGRAAVVALDALVLRSRLPWSPVFWNLRTRSSARIELASASTWRRGGLRNASVPYLKSRYRWTRRSLPCQARLWFPWFGSAVDASTWPAKVKLCTVQSTQFQHCLFNSVLVVMRGESLQASSLGSRWKLCLVHVEGSGCSGEGN
jgi:hypothetical protein